MNKKRELIFKIIIILVSLLLFFVVLFYINDGFLNQEGTDSQRHETAQIIKIHNENIEETADGFFVGKMLLDIEILTGTYHGTVIQSTYFLNQLSSRRLEINDRISVVLLFTDGDLSGAHIENIERRGTVIAFFILFLVVLALLGGKRGLLSIVSLIFTLIAIIFVLIPLALKGYSVTLITFFILVVVTLVSLTILCGFTKKAISSIVGCLFGIVVTTILTHTAGVLTNISGFNMDDVGFILARTEFPSNNASGLFISSVLIAALGALMDTSVTIASTIEELKIANPKMRTTDLFKSGMNVGKDTMGTMSSTLILAFAGSSLNMIILIYNQGTSMNQVLNSDFVVIEIIRSIAGSFGIILTIPAVAIVSSILNTRK